jgi:hypothetical protein
MRLRLTLLVSLFTLLSACGGESSTQQQASEIHTLLSWTATAQMTGEAWRQRNVPGAYTEQTLDSAAQTLNGEQAAVAQLPPVPGDTPLPDRLRRVLTAIEQMKTAVQRDDHAGIAGPLGQLAAQADAFQQMLDKLGAGQ